MTNLHLYFLGLPRFERDSQTIDVTSAKAIALLAYLALNRAPQPRERLLALLWAESAEDAARKNLRNTLWAIRKALGDNVIEADNNRVALSPIVWNDVRVFEQMANQVMDESVDPMLDVYRGPFLDGLTLTEAPDFELWMTGERERLSLLYMQVITRLVETRRREGNWQAVITLTRRALAQDGLHEAMHRALIEAHARIGDRAEALRQYDLLRTTLNHELGVDPLPETETLRTAILSGDLNPATPPAPVPDRVEKRPAILGDAPRAPFIGRQAQLDALSEELALASTHQTRVVLITGEMGMGKSRLWREWAASLPESIFALDARALESTQNLPFAPIKELFNRRICEQRLFGANTPLSPVWLAEMARLFPEIKLTFPDLPMPAALPVEEERHRILEAFTQTLMALKADPLILFIDDLHWADRATLNWCDYLIHRLRDEALLLVMAYRPHEAPTTLVHLVASWTREGVTRRLPLDRLSDADSFSLLESLVGTTEHAERIGTLSAGNPYYLIELSRTKAEQVPTTLIELVTARLDRLPESARQVLQAAAVLEPDFDFPTLTKVSGRSEDEMLDALDALLAADVLTEHAGEYTFVHPLVATIVRNSMSYARSAVLHRRAAIAREAKYANQLPIVAGRLAAHYEIAGEPIKAAEYADMASAHAMSLAAYAEAESFLRQALRLDPHPARQIKLGRLLFLNGNIAGATAAFTDAMTGYQQANDKLGTLDALLSVAELYIPAGRADEIEAWVAKAQPLLNATEDPQSFARAHFLLGVAGLANGRPLHEAESHLLEANRLSREYNLVTLAPRSAFELGNLMAERGDLAQAVDAYRDTIRLAQEAGELMQEVLGYNNAAYHTMLMGDVPEARKLIEAGLRLAESTSLRVPLQFLYSTSGEIALAAQVWDEAEMWFKRGLAEVERTGNKRQLANYDANLALAARGRGDLDGALLLFEKASSQLGNTPAPHLRIQIDLWLTELHLDRGEYVAAYEALKRAEARLLGSDRHRLEAWAKRLREQIDKLAA
jgi:DNA-binding SARP family transcriptional activator